MRYLIDQAENKHLAVTHLQRRLWILAQLNPTDISYNINIVLEIKGDLQINILYKSIEALIQRHEALRAIFFAINGEPFQYVIPFSEYNPKILFYDLRNDQNAQQSINNIINDISTQCFDLENGPLTRIAICKEAENRHIIIWSIHHIVCDAWSVKLLLSELQQLYHSFIAAHPSPLRELIYGYQHALDYQQNLLTGYVGEKKKEFWLSYFEAGIPVLDFPTDHDRPLIKMPIGGKCNLRLAEATRLAISDFSISYNLSNFVILLSALKLLFHKYTNQKDIVLGIPMANRISEEIENVVGCFVNTVAVKTEIDTADNFMMLCGKSNINLLNVYENHDYPFEKLIDDLKLPRQLNRSPIFDVTVNYIDFHIRNADYTGNALEIKEYQSETVLSKFDLEITILSSPESLEIILVYDRGLFDEWRMTSFLNNFEALLHDVLADPLQPIYLVDAISSQEKYLLESFNNTVQERSFESIISNFLKMANSKRDALAIVTEHKTITYNELNRFSDNLAKIMVSQFGLSKGDGVAMCCDHSEWHFISLLAVVKAGGFFIPVAPELPEERKAHIIKNSGAKLFLCNNENIMKAENSVEQLKLNDFEEAVFSAEHSFSPMALEENDLCYIMYTSGSTGMPKGVKITHKNITNYVNWANTYYFSKDQNYNTAFFTSFSSDLTLTSIICPLIRGDIVYVFNLPIDEALQNIFKNESNIQVVKLTPSHIELLGILEITSTNVKKMIIGGEELTNKQVQYLQRLNPDLEIYNEYGPTETTIGSTVEKVSSTSNCRSIGRPIWNTSVYILDDYNQIKPIGVNGEICIAGEGVSIGYQHGNYLIEGKFVPNPHTNNRQFITLYKTGDVGRWHKDGYLEFFGRKDDQVKIRGYRVEPKEIEQAILRYQGITSCVVLSTLAPHRGLTAYFVSPLEITGADIRNFLLQHLPEYMMPVKFVMVHEIPLNSAGKVDRAKLKSLDYTIDVVLEQNERLNQYSKTIKDIWVEVLQQSNIAIDDNFFEIGGNSIILIQVLKRITNIYGNIITSVDLFTFNTIRSLSSYIEKKYSTELNLDQVADDITV